MAQALRLNPRRLISTVVSVITLDLAMPRREERAGIVELSRDESTKNIPAVVVAAYAGNLI